MVGISIQCRLGNQLFQYAFIKAVSENHNSGYFINEKIEKFIVPDFFNLKGYKPYLNTINRAILKVKKRYLTEPLQNVIVNEPYPICDNEIYIGYFQSELYFKNIADHISDLITIKHSFKKQFEKEFGELFSKNKTVVIHIRRGDYLNLNTWWKDNLGSSDLSLPLKYYYNCLSEIEHKSAYKFLFISDDIDFVNQNFGHLKNVYIKKNNLITDFQIMMNADICVLSNSSFAWWAAYLNAKREKKIFCPEYWLGFKIKTEYPENIIPESWIQINTQ